MAARLKILKAEHGDSIIASISKGETLHHIVIDGGPSSKYAENIVNEFKNLGGIDLMVLTHFDDDHIGGLIEYFKDYDGKELPIQTCWVNCASDISITDSSLVSYSQTRTLENYLNGVSQRQRLEWKDAIVNTMEPVDLGFCKIKIVSPSPESLRINHEEYIKKEGVATISSASGRVKLDEKVSLFELANRPDIRHTARQDVINKSSIAFILETESSKILLMGDADPWIVLDKLKELGYSKENPLTIDYWKMSHHGSRNNICKDLLDVIHCSNYIFSTNGGTGSAYHPDRETLAKILCHQGRHEDDEVNFYFNYSLSEIQKRTGTLITDEEKEQYRCHTFCNVFDFSLP